MCYLIILFFEEESIRNKIKWYNIKAQKNFIYDENYVINENGVYNVYLLNQLIGKYTTFLESIKVFYKYVGNQLTNL